MVSEPLNVWEFEPFPGPDPRVPTRTEARKPSAEPIRSLFPRTRGSWVRWNSRSTGGSATRRRRPSRSARRRAESTRSSSSSATTRAACTTTSGSSATARSRAGRFRRACRWSPASAPGRPRRGPPARVRDLRGRDPQGPVRRRHGRDLGQRHVRARRGEERRRPHRPAARQAAPGPVDARPGPPRRRREELADDPQARRRAAPAARSRARTRRCWPRSPSERAGRRRLAVRGQVGRLPRIWRGRRRRGRAAQPQRHRLTERFAPSPGRSPQALSTPDCVVDGEVCALDEHGRPSFSAMQQGKPARRSSTTSSTCSRSRASRSSTSRSRSGASGSSSSSTSATGPCASPRRFDDGEALLRRPRTSRGSRASWPSGSARATARAGASRDWLKVKATAGRSSSIAGYTRGQGRRAGTLGSLVLGDVRGRRARYVGNVGTGLRRRRDRPAAEAAEAARARRRRRSARSPKMPRVRKGDVVWVEPKLVAEVEFVEWTHDGRLRAPVVQGPARGQGRARGATRGAEPIEPEIRKGKRVLKLVQPGQAVLARGGDHQGRPARVLPARRAGARPAPQRPAVHDEALSRRLAGQVLLPEGRAEAHARVDPDRRASSRRARRRGRSGGSTTPLVNDELALLWMVNMGCIDMNTWYSRIDKPDRPDFVLFDLDPSPDVGFAETVQVALLVQARPSTRSASRLRRRRAARTGSTCSCRSRGGTRTTTRAQFAEIIARRARAHAPRPRDHRVDEGEAPRRADRREPERRGQDDRVRLLGAAEGRARRSRRRCAGTR